MMSVDQVGAVGNTSVEWRWPEVDSLEMITRDQPVAATDSYGGSDV